MEYKKQYFYVDDTPIAPNHWVIRVNYDELQVGPTVGSYNLLAARLFNISYADYLRMCRDCFKADIYGKNTYYPVAYFTDKLSANEMCKALNVRMAQVLFDRENRDYDEHAEFVRKYDGTSHE